jgi:hypothetical protein
MESGFGRDSRQFLLESFNESPVGEIFLSDLSVAAHHHVSSAESGSVVQ